MNNQIYTPKKIQITNIPPINNQNQNLNLKFDINDFPILNNQKLPVINTPVVNWSNIKQNINEEHLKDLNNKKKKRGYINKQIEKGELSQVAGKALNTFVSYYDTVSSLPSSMYEKNRMFEYKRIEDLPEQFRPAAEKEIRRR
jgi:hypothetical protein